MTSRDSEIHVSQSPSNCLYDYRGRGNTPIREAAEGPMPEGLSTIQQLLWTMAQAQVRSARMSVTSHVPALRLAIIWAAGSSQKPPRRAGLLSSCAASAPSNRIP